MSEKFTRDPFDPATWPFQAPQSVEAAHARIREQEALSVQFSPAHWGDDPDARRIRSFARYESHQLENWLLEGN